MLNLNNHGAQHFILDRHDILSIRKIPAASWEDEVLRLLKSKGAPVDGFFAPSIDSEKWDVVREDTPTWVRFTFVPIQQNEKEKLDNGLDGVRAIAFALPVALFLWCGIALVLKSCT